MSIPTSKQNEEFDDYFRNSASEYGVRTIITSVSLLQIAQETKERMRGEGYHDYNQFLPPTHKKTPAANRNTYRTKGGAGN
jgi:hypothetical protein